LGFLGLRLAWRAWRRTQGRDVFLFTAGVSFFAILAAFPTLSIAVSLYAFFATPEAAHAQVRAVEQFMPSGAAQLVETELQRLTRASTNVLTLQSAFALTVSLYGAHRGFKALLAGLSFVHDEAEPRGFFGFNWLAFLVTMAAFALMGVVSTAFIVLRLATQNLPVQPLPFFWNEWLWASLSLTAGFALLYRYAMSRDPVAWRAAAIGGAGRRRAVPRRLLGVQRLRGPDRAHGGHLRVGRSGDRAAHLDQLERQRRVPGRGACDRG
jgi:membrane protein